MTPYATLRVLRRSPITGLLCPPHCVSVTHPAGLHALRLSATWWAQQDGVEAVTIVKTTSGRVVYPRPGRAGVKRWTEGAVMPGEESAPVDRANGRPQRR